MATRAFGKGVVVGCILMAVCAAVAGWPWHASCKLTWTFTTQCSEVHSRILGKMQQWNTRSPCNSTQKCGYSITSNTTSNINGTHTTRVHKYVDDLTMTFTGDSSHCTVKGHSRSQTIYAVLDDGTNYCNLHNLVEGSGLTDTTRYGFEEETDNSKCTQYSSANCKRY